MSIASELESLLISVLPDQILLQLDREGISEKGDSEGSEGGDSFKFLRLRKGAINRGTAIIRGNMGIQTVF